MQVQLVRDRITVHQDINFQLEIPPDDFRERRFIFLQTNRMPKEIREKLTKDQLSKLPFRSMTASQGSRQNLFNSQTFKSAHLRQLHHQKTKIWSGSIARRHIRKEVGRSAAALDITKSLGISSNRTSDDFYMVSHVKVPAKVVQEPLRVKSETDIGKTDFLITNSEQASIKRSPTVLEVKDKEENVSVVPKESLKIEVIEDVAQRSFNDEIIGGKCTLVKEKQKQRPTQTTPLMKQKSISEGTGKTPSLPSKPQAKQPEQSRLPVVSSKPTSTKSQPARPTISASYTIQTSSESATHTADPCSRKPVIPSLTQLAEVMNSCKALHGFGLNDGRKQEFLARGSSLHTINKFHGSQIVVDSTDYDNFARKQSKKTQAC